MNVFVVVPNWNGEDLLAECLESLQTQIYKCTVVVVDNGSVDRSVEIIEKNFPAVALVRNETNLGFAGGVNAGIRYALEHGADAVALFNNDAEADKAWLKNLVASMQKNKAGIVTCKLMRADKKYFDSTGDYYSVYGVSFPRGRNQLDKGQYDKAGPVFAASGGASLYSTKMLNEIGLFDERFFAYFEDVDISFRARLEGWEILYEPKAKAFHHVSATSSKLGDFTRFHSIKNFLMLYTKNVPGWLFWKYLPLFLYQLVRTTLRSILDLKLGVWFRSILKFISYMPGVLKDRHQIQKSRKTSVADIDRLLYKKRPPTIPELESS